MEACHVLRTPWLPCTLIVVEQSCRYTASARTYEFSATITLSCPFASLEALLSQWSVAEFSETSVTCNVWRPPSPARQTSIAALKRAHRTNAKTACIALRSSSLGTSAVARIHCTAGGGLTARSSRALTWRHTWKSTWCRLTPALHGHTTICPLDSRPCGCAFLALGCMLRNRAEYGRPASNL